MSGEPHGLDEYNCAEGVFYMGCIAKPARQTSPVAELQKDRCIKPQSVARPPANPSFVDIPEQKRHQNSRSSQKASLPIR